MSAAKAGGAGAGGDAAKQQQLVKRASKALLKQVEESRRKYTAEVEGLKSELQLLNRQALKDRRDADLASVTAAAAKKAALEATEDLERVNEELLRAKRAVQQLHRCGCCCGAPHRLHMTMMQTQRLQLTAPNTQLQQAAGRRADACGSKSAWLLGSTYVCDSTICLRAIVQHPTAAQLAQQVG